MVLFENSTESQPEEATITELTEELADHAVAMKAEVVKKNHKLEIRGG